MLNPEITLSAWLPDRLVRMFRKKEWVYPADLVGRSVGNLFKVTGFGHSAFHVLVRHLYDMGLYLDSDGYIQQMPVWQDRNGVTHHMTHIINGEKAES